MNVIITVWGALLLDEGNEVVEKIDFPRGPEALSEVFFQLDQGNIPPLLEPLASRDVGLCDNATLAEAIGCSLMGLDARQDALNSISEDIGAIFDVEKDGSNEAKRRTAIALTRKQLKVAASSKDLSISQAISAIDELDQTINLFTERLVEWYGIHFPELERLVKDNASYCEMISKYGFREDFEDERILEEAKSSMGAQVSHQDMEEMRKLASSAVSIVKIRDEYSNYIEENVSIIAPNMTALVGPLITARLMALAGGLRNLAQKPASTIQMLGAEKALFRHLKTGAKPPKHGIIFQYPEVHNTKPWHRGKIARTLAAELAIAARVDFMSGGMVAEALSEKIQKRIEEVKEKYPYPPRGKKKKKGGKRR